MTKEELAKKRGIKVTVETQTPAEKLVTHVEPPKAPPDVPKVIKNTKRPLGRPKRANKGNKKISFFVDDDLEKKLYSNLKYGDTVTELINNALREYLGG